MESKQLYIELSKPLPIEGIQRTTKEQTQKGYNTTGYGYQFIVNRFNEVLGIGGWNWSFTEIERAEGAYRSGQKFYSVTGSVTITVFLENEKSISHTEFGGHQSALITDALKGASTNALKKTSAFFGVGKQAFEKTIDEDYATQPMTKNISPIDYSAILKKAKTVEELQKIWTSLPPIAKGQLNILKEEIKIKLTK